MPQLPNRTQLTLHNSVLDPLRPFVPERKSLTQFVEDLLADRAVLLDSGLSLGKPAAPQGEAVLPSKAVNKQLKERARALSLEEINKPLEEDAVNFHKALKAAAKLPPPGFEAFWKTYQACPAPALRVKSQSKPKAMEEYRKALEAFLPSQMQRAAQTAVEEQLEAQRRDEWTAPLPDAYRWLRDGKYVVMLEDHAPTQQKPAHWL